MARSVTRTFRLDDELDQAIQTHSRNENVSVNFVMNRLVRKFIDWDLPAERFGAFLVAPLLLRRLYDQIDDVSAENLGREIAHDFYEPFIKFLFGELTFATTLMLFRRVSEYSGNFVFDSSDKQSHVIVLRHNGGQKISSYYTGVLKGLYVEILKMKLNVESTRDLCIAQLRFN